MSFYIWKLSVNCIGWGYMFQYIVLSKLPPGAGFLQTLSRARSLDVLVQSKTRSRDREMIPTPERCFDQVPSPHTFSSFVLLLQGNPLQHLNPAPGSGQAPGPRHAICKLWIQGCGCLFTASTAWSHWGGGGSCTLFAIDLYVWNILYFSQFK